MIGVSFSPFVSGIIALTISESAFQAEDGIRDALLSRGLGDVYKRQR